MSEEPLNYAHPYFTVEHVMYAYPYPEPVTDTTVVATKHVVRYGVN